MPYMTSCGFALGKNGGGMWAGRFGGGGGYIFAALARAFISSLGAEADLGEPGPDAVLTVVPTLMSPAVELVEGADGVWEGGGTTAGMAAQ